MMPLGSGCLQYLPLKSHLLESETIWWLCKWGSFPWQRREEYATDGGDSHPISVLS
jgi:hypothetical protein